MRLKDGVMLTGLRPEMAVALLCVADVYRTVVDRAPVVTSALDCKHSRTSLHYVGQAIDLRIRDLPQTVHQSLTDAIRKALSAEFDVVLEHTHIHVEYQPKR